MSTLLALVNFDREKEEAKKINDQLSVESLVAQEELKRLRQAVEQLGREYDDSKDVDSVRRYSLLKGMIKRTVMHIKITHDEHSIQCSGSCSSGGGGSGGGLGGGVGSSTRCKDVEMKRRCEQLSGLSAQEIIEANEALTEQIKEYRRKSTNARNLIEELERNYEESKRYLFIQRYRLMKFMIKSILQSNLR